MNKIIYKNDDDLYEMINYIKNNVNNLSNPERLEILQMIINSTPDNKIKSKGNGTEIKFNDLSNSIIINIYNFIFKKIKIKNEQINLLSDSESDSEN